jgi:hypothetical protein
MPEDHPPMFGFGSRLSEKYNKVLGIKLPILQFIDEKKREQRKIEVATLIASGFLGSAYELIVHHRERDNPLWEFFRHARNASFHGNRFNFERDEPTRPAEWRGLAITRSMQDDPLFFDFIQFADVFYMLADLTVHIGMPEGEQPMFGELPPDWRF